MDGIIVKDILSVGLKLFDTKEELDDEDKEIYEYNGVLKNLIDRSNQLLTVEYDEETNRYKIDVHIECAGYDIEWN